MRSPTNRVRWRTLRSGLGPVETILGETRIDGHNCALVKVDDDSESYWPYHKQVFYKAIVDISEYKNCYSLVWKKPSMFVGMRNPRIINVSKFGEIGVTFSNCSPSLWDNGFGICYYAQVVLFKVSKKDFTLSWMKFSLRNGITEKNFGTMFEQKIAQDIIEGLGPVFNVFNTCGVPKLIPVVDDF